jgi:hypothetical protein
MRINVNGQIFDATPEQEQMLLAFGRSFVEGEYAKLSGELRLGAKMIARKMLQDQENSTREKFGKDAAMVFRPAKRSDAVLHLLSVAELILREALKNVTLTVDVNADCITHLSISTGEDKAGGQMALNGD